jgi:hypothetical protein
VGVWLLLMWLNDLAGCVCIGEECAWLDGCSEWDLDIDVDMVVQLMKC